MGKKTSSLLVRNAAELRNAVAAKEGDIRLAEGTYELAAPLVIDYALRLRGGGSLLQREAHHPGVVAAVAMAAVATRSALVAASAMAAFGLWRLVVASRESTKIVASDGAVDIRAGASLDAANLSLASLGEAPCVLTRGKLALTDCQVQCLCGNGIECASSSSSETKEEEENSRDSFDLEARNCHVRYCGKSGVAVLGGRARLTGITLTRSKRFGVELRGGVSASVENCSFRDGGLCVSSKNDCPGARIHVRNCHLTGEAMCLPGLSVVGAGAAPPPRAKVKDDEEEEEQKSSSSKKGVVPPPVLFEECAVSRVNGTGIYLLGTKTFPVVELRGCVVRHAAMAGVEALRGVTLRASDCAVSCNSGGGVILHRDASATLRRCDVTLNGGGGNLGVVARASAALTDCAVLNANAVGVQVCRASVALHRCRVENRGPAVVLGGRASEGFFDHNARRGQRRSHSSPSKLAIADSTVRGTSGDGVVYVAPHSGAVVVGDHDVPPPAEHVLVVRDSLCADDRDGGRPAFAFDAPTAGCLAGIKVRSGRRRIVKFGPNWRGTSRLSWKEERLLHCGATHLESPSPLRALRDCADVLRLIIEFASS